MRRTLRLNVVLLGDDGVHGFDRLVNRVNLVNRDRHPIQDRDDPTGLFDAKLTLTVDHGIHGLPQWDVP